MQTKINLYWSSNNIWWKSFWNFDNDTARNVVTFVVDNSSSPHIDKGKNSFLVLGNEPIKGINGSAGTAEKNIALTLAKQTLKFAQVYITMVMRITCM